jgi:hypothetical protein
MVGVLLGAKLGGRSADGTPLIGTSLTSPLVTGDSGLTWGCMGRVCVILMPLVDHDSDTSKIASDLLRVYEDASGCDCWLIDCSAIKSLPILLVALLLGYKESLAKHARNVGLVWLQQSVLPKSIFERVQKHFNLKLVGDFFFSDCIDK